uniref:Uncharacterized protein n=1 Tax=Coccidioides posadasii RMSCC 3488 TaxID=454284 RepID=A0A0J6FEF5_COCPO|nr:hypothetical protein CPAG_03619 [Coccidioides posadasii RMSCC 3488]
MEPNGAPHSATKDPRRKPQDPVQLFLDYATEISVFGREMGKRERLTQKVRQQEAMLNRAADRQFQYPSYLSRGKAMQKEQMDRLNKIDQQLDLHKKKQADLSEVFSHLMARNDTFQQLKLDVSSCSNSIESATRGLKQVEDIRERLNKLEQKFHSKVEKELSSLRLLRSHCQSIVDRNRNTEKWNLTRCDLLEQRLSDIENKSASNTIQSEVQSLSRRLDETEELSAAQHQLLEGRVTAIENQKGPNLNTLRADMENLFSQLEKLREFQDQKDKEIDNELQRLELGRSSSIEKLHSDYAMVKDQLGEHLRTQDINNAAHEARIMALEKRDNADVAQMHDALKYHSERLAGHNVAITSLESRYNKLSSEPLVRQMVASMQEMYPYASTAQKEIEELRKGLNDQAEMLNSISARLEAVQANQAGEKTERLSMIKDMNSERARINDSIKGAINRLDEVERVTAEKLAKVIFDSRELTKVCEKPERAASPSVSLGANPPDTSSNREEIYVRTGRAPSRPSSQPSSRPSSNPPLNISTNMPHRPPSPHEEELRIRSGPSPPPLASRASFSRDDSPRDSHREDFRTASDFSPPRAPMSMRTTGPPPNSDLHRRVSFPSRPPPEPYLERGDSYRPGSLPKKRRRGNGYDDLDGN